MPAWGPSRPLRQMAGSRVAALWYDPPWSGGRRPLTHSPRREVVSGPATPRVPTPRLLGVSKEWLASPGVLRQPPLSTDRSLARHPSGHSLTAWYSQQHLFTASCTSRTVLSDDSEQAKSISLSEVSGVANERITRLIELFRQEVSFPYLNKSCCASDGGSSAQGLRQCGMTQLGAI